MAWQDLHMHNIVLHEHLVNGWGKVWGVTFYLIRALGLNSMEAVSATDKKITKLLLLFNFRIFLILIVRYKLAIES